MLNWEQVSKIVASKSEEDLEKLTKLELYAFLKSMKDELDRRQEPKKRGKHKPKHSVLPIPKDLYNGVRRLTITWLKKQSKAKI